MDEIESETKTDIEKRAEKLLAEIGIKNPPVNLEAVADFLNVDCGYYDLTDPHFLREIGHKITIGVHNLQSILRKVDLRGLWLPDRDQVLIDQNLASAKHRWVTAHELSHRLLPTHRPFFLGDTAETLDPEYHVMLESEANYCTQQILFMGSGFDEDMHSLPHCLDSVLELSKRYKNSGAEVDPENWTGRIDSPTIEKRSACPKNAVTTVPSSKPK